MRDDNTDSAPETDSSPLAVSALGEERTARFSRRLGILGAGVAIALVVALFAVLSWQRGSGGAAPPTVVPASWQTYHDPAGLFSLGMPPGWAVHLETSTETFGDRTGSATETDEFLSVSNPAQGGGARFQVDASPIRTAFERHWYCQAFPGNDTTFHGFPLTLTDQPMWLFDTANAHFQLDVVIPGVLGPPNPGGPLLPSSAPAATPLPAATAAVDRQLLTTMLGAFAPTDTRALAC